MKAVLQFANVVVVPVFAGKRIVTMVFVMITLVRLILTCEHFKRFCWASACPVADRTEICQMNHDDYISYKWGQKHKRALYYNTA